MTSLASKSRARTKARLHQSPEQIAAWIHVKFAPALPVPCPAYLWIIPLVPLSVTFPAVQRAEPRQLQEA